ncbi:M1 family metallopeptidase [Cytophaga aurantiaca]|uniref:M1 family metallopeptidase n=1 Tax=Cytophaga aurantiaca TaxID=29530 RepID=UPI00037EF569|nr:M1 family metallopeptidase [Cytophaga aurantiaca]
MHRFIVFLFIGFFCTIHSSYSQKIYTHQDSLRGGLSINRTCFDVTYYNLSLKVDITNKFIQGSNDIFFNVVSNTSQIQLDLFSNLIIDSVFSGKTKLAYKREGNAFFVFFPTELIKNESHVVTVFYEGNPIIAKKAPWDGGWVFTQDSLKRPWVGVACEGIGASLWWPMKDHLSDEPDSMRIHYTVPSTLTAVGNGTLESTISNTPNKGPQTITYNWKVNYPINSYNVTCNIAHYAHIHDTHIQINKDSLAIDYYILDYNKQKAINHFKQVHPMLTCYEKYFGPYPFFKDGYAMVETPYWGMEHQGAVAYGNDYSNKIIDFDYIIIHESAHEWWGNNVSVKDHAEMWIHESFTTYAENLLVEYIYGYDMSIRYLNLNKPLIKNESPIVGPLNVNYEGWEDSDMYYKGAWILHTFRSVLKNDSLWFSILKGMQKDLALKTVQTSDVIAYINNATHSDYTWFFNQYLYNAKPPILEYYTEKHKKNIRVYYKWNNTQVDFRMMIPLNLTSKEVRYITPSLGIQYIDIKNKEYSKDFFNLNYNYYLLTNSKNNK